MLHVLLSVVAASLLGSLHCAGMCGGFVAFYAGGDTSERQRSVAHVAYNLGRLLTYSIVGAFAGLLGSVTNVASTALGFGRIAAVVAGLVMLAWGGVLLFNVAGVRFPKSKLLGRLPEGLSRRLSQIATSARSKPPTVRAFVLGFSSTLLPCGWLYAFAVAAAGTASPLWGALVMVAFWSGTLPVMLGLGVGVQRLGQRLRRHIPALSAALLVIIGTASVLGRLRLDEVVRTATMQMDQKARLGATAPEGEAPCCHHDD
ncbi:MAG: sulfite exporter TauE/SafE family protein [Myxococcales bacterium]|nr:sulfite exporter TauE/SafE family protein [Myxococcales bacterium]